MLARVSKNLRNSLIVNDLRGRGRPHGVTRWYSTTYTRSYVNPCQIKSAKKFVKRKNKKIKIKKNYFFYLLFLSKCGILTV